MLAVLAACALEIAKKRVQSPLEDVLDPIVQQRLMQLAGQALGLGRVGARRGPSDRLQRRLQLRDVEANRPRMARMQDEQLGDSLRVDARMEFAPVDLVGRH